jgi:hypothetical protein
MVPSASRVIAIRRFSVSCDPSTTPAPTNTPTQASGPHQVERWIGMITQRPIRR